MNFEMLCFIGIRSELFSKRELQLIYNEDTDDAQLDPQFYSVCENEGFIALTIIEPKNEGQVSLSEMIELKNAYFLDNEENKDLYKDFFKKFGREELYDKVEIYVYNYCDGLNDSFYDKLSRNKFL